MDNIKKVGPVALKVIHLDVSIPVGTIREERGRYKYLQG